MKKASYLLNILLIAVIGFFAYKFIFEGNVATESEDRIAVVLTASEKAKVLAEMRGLLETSQAVLFAATSDDIASIPDIVRPFGMAATENESITMMTKLPFELKTMGHEAHGAMDGIGAMAESGATGNEIIEALAVAMTLCVTCHDTYRFVAEEEMN